MREKATSLITSTAMLSGEHCPAKFLWAQHCPWGITGNPYEFWILPILSISPFLCPLQSQNPKVTFRKPESTFHIFQCSKSHIGKDWHEWLMQPGETASQPGFCPGLTFVSPQGTQISKVRKQNSTHSSESPFSPVGFTDYYMSSVFPQKHINFLFYIKSCFRMDFWACTMCVWKSCFLIFISMPFLLLLSILSFHSHSWASLALEANESNPSQAIWHKSNSQSLSSWHVDKCVGGWLNI